jgi:putative transposase
MSKSTRWERMLSASPQLAYWKTKDTIPDKWILLRNLGKKILSRKAQEKLEWIIFSHTIGGEKATFTANYFGITRKTLHKYLSRFDDRNLRTLEEHSRSPKNTRLWEVTSIEEKNIKDLRKKNMELGKKKLQVLYLKEYDEKISTWKIERVIRKHRLYPDPIEQKKRIEKRRRTLPKVRIHTVKKQLNASKEFGRLWHIDAIIIWWYGHRRILFTALEDTTKIAFARAYKTNTSGFAEDFLKRLLYIVDGKVTVMHSDNGSEFAGAFEKACTDLKILQIFSRPYTPKDNPALERFNGTIQKEWLNLSEVGLSTITDANHDLTKWLVKYNSYRPHEALDYKTPLEYAQDTFFKVSPMWSAGTRN